MRRTIDKVFEKPDGSRHVKFDDGTEAFAKKDAEFVCPLEAGVEAELMTEERRAGGRPYDLIVLWGLETPPSVAAQAPLEPPAPEAPPKGAMPASAPSAPTNGRCPVRIDPRDRSIIAQVALKEAREYAANRAALGGSKSMDTDAQIVKRAKAYNAALLEMVGAE